MAMATRPGHAKVKRSIRDGWFMLTRNTEVRHQPCWTPDDCGESQIPALAVDGERSPVDGQRSPLCEPSPKHGSIHLYDFAVACSGVPPGFASPSLYIHLHLHIGSCTGSPEGRNGLSGAQIHPSSLGWSLPLRRETLTMGPPFGFRLGEKL